MAAVAEQVRPASPASVDAFPRPPFDVPVAPPGASPDTLPATTYRALAALLAYRPDLSPDAAPSHRAPEVSVVVPTLNERDNVVRLFSRLELALAGRAWEAIFVDDGSGDGTVDILTALAQRDPRARLIRRFGRRGLSSAVIEGMLSSTAPVVAVIDADLQHDESVLPRLLDAVAGGACDLAVGSRYALGGSVGSWSHGRAAMSRVATRLADWVMPVPLADPMSGFFAVRRDAVVAAAPHLAGTGYKILLDLVASAPVPLRVSEVSYRFRPREAGESKLDALVTLEYLSLLLEKTVGRVVPIRFLLFSAVGSLGVGVHLAVLGAALRAGLAFTAATALATLVALTGNFAGNTVLTYRDRRLRGWRALAGLVRFYAVCGFGAAANIGVAGLVSGRSSWWLAGIAGAAVGSLWNYAAGGFFAWRRGA